MAGSRVPPKRFTERKLVLLVADLARTTQAVARFGAAELAEFVNSFFAACGKAVSANGGRIVTFLGDGCLAVFPEGDGLAAIETALALRTATQGLRSDFDVDVDIGVNIHQSIVAEGEFEPDDRYNVMGAGVIHTFRMGGGPGIRISEPVYRQLPNDRRGAWRKQRPPATYTLEGS